MLVNINPFVVVNNHHFINETKYLSNIKAFLHEIIFSNTIKLDTIIELLRKKEPKKKKKKKTMSLFSLERTPKKQKSSPEIIIISVKRRLYGG